MSKLLSFARVALAGLLTSLISPLPGQTVDPAVGVAVKIYAKGVATTAGNLTVSGTFLSDTPGQPDAPATTTTSTTTNGTTLTTVLGPQGYVRVEPGKAYTVSVNAPTIQNGELNIVAPPGYRVLLDHMIRSRETFSGMLMAVFELQPLGARHPGVAGISSSTPSNEIEWRISLGALRNGGSAGELALIENGAKPNWGPVFTPARLYYEASSDEVWVYRPNNTIRQIRANQVVVDVVTLTLNSYEIRCYHPSQERTHQIPHSDESTFVGQPYITYKIEQVGAERTLKITKDVRNVVDPLATNLTPARREALTLACAGTWPNLEWTKTDWTLDGQQALSETFVKSEAASGQIDRTALQGVIHNKTRTETSSVRAPNPGGSPNSPVTFATRTFTTPLTGNTTVVGEVLAQADIGSSMNLMEEFEYYADPVSWGSLGYVKWNKSGGGNWMAYEYYDTDLASGFRGGRVKRHYKPYLNAPATVSFNASQGEVVYHEYVNDLFGAPTRPSLTQTTINGTMVSKTTLTYNDAAGIVNGYPFGQSVRTDYSLSGQPLQTTIRYYRDDSPDSFVRGKTHAIISPDGTKQAFAYQRGSWTGTVFTPGNGVGIGGDATRISIINGTTHALGGSWYSTHDSYALDSLYLVDGKSTMDVTIRDSRALVVRKESYVRKTGAWVLVSHTTYVYDFAGHLVQRTASNGSIYSATYSGGLKTSETDEAGVTTTYDAYDVHGRVSIATRTGAGAIGAVATRFTYDAAGRITKEEVGYNQTGAIITQRAWDDAGRPTSVTPPGNYGVVTYSYDVATRSQTTNRADGSTVINTSYLDGRAYSITGTGTVAEYHTYGVESDGRRWYRTDIGLASSPRWKKTWKDWLGRDLKNEHPGYTGQPNIVKENFYGITANQPSMGHLVRSTTTGLAQSVYEYNTLGQVSRSGLDYNNNGVLELASSDRITETEGYLESYNGAWWMRTDTRTYPKLGLNTVLITSTSRTRMTGHGSNRVSENLSIDTEGNVTTQTVDVNRTARTSVATTRRSGIPTAMTETTLNGLSINVTTFEGLSSSTTYDAFLRPGTVTDSRGNTSTSTFIAGTTLVHTSVNAAGNTVLTTYDNMGRMITQRDPKNHYTRYSYNLRGQVHRQWGDGTMPVEYGYNTTYGDRITMSTYRSGTGWGTVNGDGGNAANPWPTTPGTADTTTWAYDGPSGLLISKTDALGRTTSQTYNLRGQTATRTLARGVITTYGYNTATGELLTQTYSDNTPAVTYTYGRTGQVETIADVTGTRDLVYDPDKPWRMTAEAHSSFYGNRVQTRLYDEIGTIGRVRGFQLGANAGSTSDLEQTFGFTTVGRFETITTNRLGNTAAPRTFRYTYRTDSGLLDSLGIDQGAGPGGHAFTVKREYEDDRDVVTSIHSKWSTTLRTGYDYISDERGQRSKVVQSGDAFSDYGGTEGGKTSRQFTYNGRGELTGDIGYLGSDITASAEQMPGRRHEYGYDTAGNRLWSNRTGNATLRDDYTTNALNQYATRENNTVPISGTAAPGPNPPTALANGDTAVAVQGGTTAPVRAGRRGGYWHDEVTVPNVDNTTNPPTAKPWRGPLTIFTAKKTVGGDLIKMDTRMAEIAAVLQSFNYDLDGNLTSDGISDYTWDAENRLIRIETTIAARSYNFPHKLVEFRYDYMGRRVQKRVVDVTQSLELSSRRFLYDGWNLIAEYLAPGGTTIGTLVRSYTWGLDIVNTLASAGGVGALLQIADHPSGSTYLPTYDGNGNIAALLNATSGTVAAAYEYSPFGEPLRAQVFDSSVADNPFRFSTKYTDSETGLVYYGHRYYDPRNGRFINKDPIEETGGLNLYGFCGNNGVNRWDYLGMAYEIEATDYGSFYVTATDADGNVGEWNFGTRQDAENWGEAWGAHVLSVVGDRSLTLGYVVTAFVNNPANRWEDIGVVIPPEIQYEYELYLQQLSAVSPYDGSDGYLNGFGTDNFVGSMTGNDGSIWWAANYTTALNIPGFPGLTYDDLLPGGRLNREGHDGPSLLGFVFGWLASNSGLDLSSIGKGPLLAARGNGLYTDGSIPWVSSGGEAAAAGTAGLLTVTPPTAQELFFQAGDLLAANPTSVSALLNFLGAGLNYTGGAGVGMAGGVLANANFAQRTFSRSFSSQGAFAGQTIDDVALALRAGRMSVADVPIQYVVRDGTTLILNTRSAQALELATIPRAQWNAVNMTGNAAAEARLTGQLQRNGLPSGGTPVVIPWP